MHIWIFSAVTIEKGRVSFKVTAKDKRSAIDKGFKTLERKFLSYANSFDCRLVV